VHNDFFTAGDTLSTGQARSALPGPREDTFSAAIGFFPADATGQEYTQAGGLCAPRADPPDRYASADPLKTFAVNVLVMR
jgi:hypothetical protein